MLMVNVPAGKVPFTMSEPPASVVPLPYVLMPSMVSDPELVLSKAMGAPLVELSNGPRGNDVPRR